jgi:DNA-binding MarR family transcriptional regulator
MNRIFTSRTPMPGYLILPRGLLRLELSATELSVYMLLLDRARISARSEAWQDEEGKVFLYYPIVELAKDAGRSGTSVKTALRCLEEKDLIIRKRQRLGRPNRIYVKLPEGAEAAAAPSSAAGESEGKEAAPAESKASYPTESKPSYPAYGKVSYPQRGRYLPPNKNYREKTKELSIPNGPTEEEYQRMQRYLEKLEKRAETAKSLTQRSPEPSPGPPPSYP